MGRAVVEAALERGDDVSTLNRGLSRAPAPGVHLWPWPAGADERAPLVDGDPGSTIPWWLRRLSKGGRVLAPAPARTSLQHIDVRDLAVCLLRSAGRGLSGAFTTAGPPGAITSGDLLSTALEVIGCDAELVWAEPELLLRHGLPLGMEFGLRAPRSDAPSPDTWLDVAAEQRLLDHLTS
ncbi:hypothetical protein E1295_01765 [Nonomuraea mesophila]|uniref:NAD-dependent epimerase/dehydratase family protein n=1 Tax=Nonomuraea mesophila TaxID=2530382 RepID=A0A4R5FX50_9ACTN|nr:hypothetical protein E1295_01765 [Nonomuraea mesophila]